ncbi:hypothetical protein HYH03_004241 [Edaphochlamys debaryana]|uniref:ABC1 atypical kinase-like domain-containing protein n=1 Tax=Edaphochlamys debaryana TaxID=47281 RepID=A0A836C3P3_9CHLO|nr:hypothetical protein HYH03_004241 [Edaphochlamys debaryana]|eukprot:KAG2497982.1 hypothetical protein HYH03_004241 [Edaphochlamys debaryana]
MRSAGRRLGFALKQGLQPATEAGPSTSYQPAFGQSVQLWRGVRLAAGHSALTFTRGPGIGLGRQADRALRRETESFMRKWRSFKTVALGSGAGAISSGQGLLTALLPPALLWLLMVLPASYRVMAFKLMGMAPPASVHAQSYSGSTPSLTSPSSLSILLSRLLQALGLTALASSIRDEILLAARAAYLWCLFLPAVLSAPIVVALNGPGRETWLRLVQWTLEHAGPAFIKWGQWASTRPDLFPEDLCSKLEQLQTSAPGHSPAYTVVAVERAFSAPISELFDTFEEQPLASGSIAQVHVAALSAHGAAMVGNGAEHGALVAVKVRHPGVTDVMHRDFILMQRAAAICSRLPALASLRLEESIRQFGGPLREQLDLSVEASHLSRFNANFRAWSNVRFPVPLFPLVTADVLVESFEEGDLISRYVRQPHRHNALLAQAGVDVFLNMMLKDNFIHADLHPGNIVVKQPEPPSPAVARLAALLPPTWRLRSWLVERQPQIVLLDTGMIVTLSEEDQSSLLGFFRALTRMDGRKLAAEIVKMSVDGRCKDPAIFAAELESMFATMDREYLRIESQAVMRDIIERMRQHEVTLRSSVSTVVVTSLVLEGWSSKLDPDVRILETMRDMLADSLVERLGSAVDRVMASGALLE